MRKVLTGMLCLLPALAALTVFTVPASAAPTIKQLRTQLRQARQVQSTAAAQARAAEVDLAAALAAQAEAQAGAAAVAEGTETPAATETPTAQSAPVSEGLMAALLADGVISNEELAALEQTAASRQARADRWAKRVKVLKGRLRQALNIRRWNRQGKWWPLIKIAAKRYKVNPYGLRRMMMLESGGRRYAGTTYRGLFQYHPSTWRSSWNPWRRLSIYNGWAQIRATARAIGGGAGPRQWPHTYRMAF